MTAHIEPQHDLSPTDLGAIEERLYDFNRRAIGRDDGRGLRLVIRDDAGRVIGVAAGYSWAGTSELKQMCKRSLRPTLTQAYPRLAA